MNLEKAKQIYDASREYNLDEDIILTMEGLNKDEYKSLIKVYLKDYQETTDRDRFSEYLDEFNNPRNYEFYTGRWMSEEFILGR